MKKIIAIFLLAALWGMASLCAAAKPKYLPASDSYIQNVGNVQVRSVVSPAYISEFLGAVIDIRQGEKVIGYNQAGDSAHLWDEPAIVYFEGGTVWLDDPSGETDMDTEAPVIQAIFTKRDVFTARGIHIGDNASLIYKKYGQPRSTKQNKNKSYRGIVDVWRRYDTESGAKLLFGIRDGRVTAISVSIKP
ncbi:MAG: hypothetical protein IJ741_08250 [Schwartzia sp.]|nr:hypothetical protein [Schwartzia sp. (in: firmicutes)]